MRRLASAATPLDGVLSDGISSTETGELLQLVTVEAALLACVVAVLLSFASTNRSTGHPARPAG